MATHRKIRFDHDDYRSRPRELDHVKFDLICDRISNGETLVEICDADRDMPLPGTFLKWCEEDPSLAEEHDKARRRGADVNFDSSVDAAFDADYSRGRVRAEALRYHVERTHPEKYSPRATLNVPEKKEPAGHDAGAELRRRIEAMAARNELALRAANEGQNPSV